MSILGLFKTALSIFTPPRGSYAPPAPRGHIEIQEDSFTINWTWGTDTISFDEISELAAYKADVFAYDLICCHIAFRSIGGIGFRQVDEEMWGFHDLMKRFEALPGFDREWYQKVVLPPFVQNWTVIFQRNPAHEETVSE